MSRIIIFTLAIFFFSLPSVSRAGEIEQMKEALGEASGKREQALIYKKMGDYYSSQDDFESAAGHYERALALDRQGFPAQTRITMANRISWGGGRDRAEEELRNILSDEPANTGALISLARVVSWSGRLDPALEEVEKALKAEPGNREALLVKANILRWKGKNRDAEAVYKKLLEGGEDFDARLGLAYAQLAMGDRKGSQENAAALKPSTRYQEGQLREYNETAAAGDRAEARTGYYSDSDFNRVKRYSLGGAFRTGDLKTDLSYSETVANDGVRDNRVDAISLSASSRVAEFMASGGATLSKTTGAGGASFLTGYVRTDFNIDDSSVSIAARREFLTDTALLIENGIRATVLSLSLSRPLPGRLRLYGGAAYRRYSDDNSAIDLQIAPVYTIISKDPRLSVGYRLRYIDYERQSRGGYFDPFNFLSNQVFAALSFERGGVFYARIEPYIGYQSHRRYESNESRSFMGALAGAGFKPAKGLDIEASVEGGNYALGTSAGFRYYLLGLRLTYAPS